MAPVKSSTITARAKLPGTAKSSPGTPPATSPIGEIKSSDQLPSYLNGRQKQPNGVRKSAAVRAKVLARENAAKLGREIGGLEIIIRGQIPSYVFRFGKTYDLPADKKGKIIKGGYSVPALQSANVVKALIELGKKYCQIIYDGKGSIIYIFDLD